MVQNILRISQGLETSHEKMNLNYFVGRKRKVLEIISTFLILHVSVQFLCGWVEAVSCLFAGAGSDSNTD